MIKARIFGNYLKLPLMSFWYVWEEYMWEREKEQSLLGFFNHERIGVCRKEKVIRIEEKGDWKKWREKSGKING